MADTNIQITDPITAAIVAGADLAKVIIQAEMQVFASASEPVRQQRADGMLQILINANNLLLALQNRINHMLGADAVQAIPPTK